MALMNPHRFADVYLFGIQIPDTPMIQSGAPRRRNRGKTDSYHGFIPLTVLRGYHHVFESGTFTYFKCRQSAMFNSVISPAPEIRLISSSFLPMANAVTADGLMVFREVWDLD